MVVSCGVVINCYLVLPAAFVSLVHHGLSMSATKFVLIFNNLAILTIFVLKLRM